MTHTPENHGIVEVINNSTNDNIKNYNTVFRQAANNLIVGAGILLALSTQIIGQLKDGSVTLKVLSILVVIFLSLSIAFGIIQQLMEATFFRKKANQQAELLDKVFTTNLKVPATIEGRFQGLRAASGKAVKRWALAVQLVLLSLALVLIIAVTIVYLF